MVLVDVYNILSKKKAKKLTEKSGNLANNGGGVACPKSLMKATSPIAGGSPITSSSLQMGTMYLSSKNCFIAVTFGPLVSARVPII